MAPQQTPSTTAKNNQDTACLQAVANTARSLVLAGKSPEEVANTARAGGSKCKPKLKDTEVNLLLTLAEGLRLPGFKPQDFREFMKRNFPPKEPLIEGVLYKRDQISLTGRRRHGKTQLVSNLGMAGAAGRKEFLGYTIARPFTTLLFLLEDDGGELQSRFARQQQEEPNFDAARLHLYIRQDFFERKIRIDFSDTKFRAFILAACEAARQASGSVDLIIFDNLGMLIGADYNNPTKIHALMELMYELTQRYDAAILIAAHPKKGSKLDIRGESIHLKDDSERFFEECMGSSHFINSTGSLWGIERDKKAGRTFLLWGAQRHADTEGLTSVVKNEHDWLEPVDDFDLAQETLLNTPQRQKAWSLLPDNSTFTYSEAWKLVQAGGKDSIKSQGTFTPWWNELKRKKLIVTDGGEHYRKGKRAVPATNWQKFLGWLATQTVGMFVTEAQIVEGSGIPASAIQLELGKAQKNGLLLSVPNGYEIARTGLQSFDRLRPPE